MADTLDITFNLQPLAQLGAGLDGYDTAVQQQLIRANAAIVRETEKAIAQIYGPKYLKLWEVRSSVNRGGSMSGGDAASITAQSNDKRMTFKEFGTKPHLIRARRAHALHFLMGEQSTFARSVHHPGQRARNGLPELALKASSQFIYWENALGTALDAVL